jgi:uroporphyrinogen-III decarboxylase
VVFLDDFIDAGFDILNPIQTSASGMDPVFLKERYGRHLVFWGGGIDTQRVLPFSSPDQIREQVKERIQVFGKDGGFVFNAIHNIQPMIPVENLVALFEAVNEYRSLH